MPDDNKKLNLNWSAVEKALSEGTFSGYKMGILETEKIFSNFLAGKNIPGQNINAKIKYVTDFLSRAEQLKYARDIYKKIIEQPHFEISRDETKQAIQGYWQAMLDLEEAIVSLSSGQKLSLRFKFFYGQIIKKIKKIAVIFGALLLMILFFGETGVGKKTAAVIASAAHFLVFRIGPWILGLAIAGLLLWFGLKILGKRKREF